MNCLTCGYLPWGSSTFKWKRCLFHIRVLIFRTRKESRIYGLFFFMTTLAVIYRGEMAKGKTKAWGCASILATLSICPMTPPFLHGAWFIQKSASSFLISRSLLRILSGDWDLKKHHGSKVRIREAFKRGWIWAPGLFAIGERNPRGPFWELLLYLHWILYGGGIHKVLLAVYWIFQADVTGSFPTWQMKKLWL